MQIVINDIAWHILLIARLMWMLDAMIIDISTAFLYCNLDERNLRQPAKRADSFDDECLLLLKSLYRLVQAQQWVQTICHKY